MTDLIGDIPLAPLPDPEPVTTTYPAHYPVHFALHFTYDRRFTVPTLEGWDIEDRLDLGAPQRITTEQVAPDGRSVIEPAFTGPVLLKGPCPSTIWVIDSGREWRDKARFMAALGAKVEAWEVFGAAVIGERDSLTTWLTARDSAVAGRDGFRLRCVLPAGHRDTPCGAGPAFRWSPQVGPLAP